MRIYDRAPRGASTLFLLLQPDLTSKVYLKIRYIRKIYKIKYTLPSLSKRKSSRRPLGQPPPGQFVLVVVVELVGVVVVVVSENLNVNVLRVVLVVTVVMVDLVVLVLVKKVDEVAGSVVVLTGVVVVVVVWEMVEVANLVLTEVETSVSVIDENLVFVEVTLVVMVTL